MKGRSDKQIQPPSPPNLTISRKEAEEQLTSRIEIGKQLLSMQVSTDDELKKSRQDYYKWNDFNKELLRRIFDSPEYNRLSIGVVSTYSTLSTELKYHREDISERISKLESIKERLPLYQEQGIKLKATQTVTKDEPMQKQKTVFIVHGKDETAKDKLARFLEKLELNPIILHEQANRGQSILEKLEHYSEVAFAIILLTPDDVGNLVSEANTLLPRARQNVIFELGYFLGKLGRDRVCALYNKEIELPSDFIGVVYIPLADDDSWKLLLAREIKAAGLNIDLNKVI
jgi:predicted nucleotide-binding protein